MRVFDREHLILEERRWHDQEAARCREPLRARLRKWRIGTIGALCSRFLKERMGAGERLDVHSMLAFYRCGLLPFYRFASLEWSEPPLREAIAPDEFRIGGPTRRFLREEKYRVTFDNDFRRILGACVEQNGHPPGKLIDALSELHRAGHAHSVEVWDGEQLVGGLYGIGIGDVFFAESRFDRVCKASNVAIAVLHHHLSHWGFALRTARWIDRRHPHSARIVDREIFQVLLRNYADRPGRVGKWTVEASLDTYGWSSGLKGVRRATKRLIPRTGRSARDSLSELGPPV